VTVVKEIIELFKLPKTTIVDRRLEKKKIYEQANTTSAQRRLISDAIERIRVVASINPKTMNIPAVESDTHRVSQIPIFWIEMREPKQTLKVTALIHRLIDHPLILLCSDEKGNTLFSSATKRINQSDTRCLTVEYLYETEWYESDLPEAFAEKLSVAKHPLENLQKLYESYCNLFVSQKSEALTGGTASEELSLDEQRELIDRLQVADKELGATINKAKREKQNQKQIELNKQIRTLRKEITDIKEKLGGSGV